MCLQCLWDDPAWSQTKLFFKASKIAWIPVVLLVEARFVMTYYELIRFLVGTMTVLWIHMVVHFPSPLKIGFNLLVKLSVIVGMKTSACNTGHIIHKFIIQNWMCRYLHAYIYLLYDNNVCNCNCEHTYMYIHVYTYICIYIYIHYIYYIYAM